MHVCLQERSGRERHRGINVVQLLHPVNGVIGHGGGQVPAGIADVRIYSRSVAEQVWLPLAGVTADEAIEVLEAHADRPLIEWTGLTRASSPERYDLCRTKTCGSHCPTESGQCLRCPCR